MIIPYICRAWVAGSLAPSGCLVLGAWLSDGRDDWDIGIIRRNEPSFVFLSGAMRRFLPSRLTTTDAICRLRLLIFFSFICAHTSISYSSTSGLVVFPSTGAVRRLGLLCVFFLLIFVRPLLVSPLFPFPLHLCWPLFCSSLPWVRGLGTLYLAILALVFLYSHSYQNGCPDQFDSTWVEGVDPRDSTVKAAGCLCCAVDGRLVYLCSLLPPSNHQPSRTQQPTHELCMVSYS